MSELKNQTHWVYCEVCKGRGKKSKGLTKKTRLQYKRALEKMEDTKNSLSIQPKTHFRSCSHCSGTGLVTAEQHPTADPQQYPHVAIIGAGIAGVAFALACLHRKIPFTLFERDQSFAQRSQGYGLTLQQASKAMKEFGIAHLEDGIISTKHIIHNSEGKIIGEWGKRKWTPSHTHEKPEKEPKKTNIHIARQSLRRALLEQLGGADTVHWGHQLVGFENNTDSTTLKFKVDDSLRAFKAHLVVGADGIRSTVRQLIIGEEQSPLHYLGCIVLLGICSLQELEAENSDLLDEETVFQTANGVERIYMMPFAKGKIMWQLSFPMSEQDAKALSAKGAKALKEEACKRTKWHSPIPEILEKTEESAISGYPVYDRALLNPSLLKDAGAFTLIGDAAHPMSPFKGQGANQALLDALQLARQITFASHTVTSWTQENSRAYILTHFEKEMIDRSSVKVKDSAAAAEFLHSDIVLKEGDKTMGAKWLSSL